MSKQPRRFWTSDIHIGHLAVATRFRPFESVEEHDATLAQNWDTTVRENDIVYVLGDIAINPRRDDAFGWLQRRPGRKHLISGNHDLVHPLHGTKAFQEQRKPEWLEVFETVNPFARISIDGRKVLMSHFPLSGEGSRELEERYSEWRIRLLPEGAFLLHGHTHSTEKVGDDPRQIHVGVDAWNWTPVSEQEIAQLMGGSDD